MSPGLAGSEMVKRNDMPVKVGVDVIRDAKVVAAYLNVSLAEYLTEVLRPIVAKDLEQEHAKRVRASKKDGKSQ